MGPLDRTGYGAADWKLGLLFMFSFLWIAQPQLMCGSFDTTLFFIGMSAIDAVFRSGEEQEYEELTERRDRNAE